MSLATLAQAQAKAMIKRLNAAVTLTRTAPGAYNTTTGTTGTATTTTNSTYGHMNGSGNLGYKYGQDLVQAGDFEVLISAKGLTISPLPGDQLAIGGVTYVIKAVKPEFVGSTAVVYSCLVRK